MKNLHLYKKNIYSQNGEDGVILEIRDMKYIEELNKVFLFFDTSAAIGVLKLK